MGLRQVEADVVIALSCDKGDFVRGRIIPIWECEDNLFVLTDFAEQKALWLGLASDLSYPSVS